MESDSASPSMDSSDAFERISEREREVLRLMDAGRSDKEIADLLSISVHTVRNHEANIRTKWGTHNHVQTLNEARRRGLL